MKFAEFKLTEAIINDALKKAQEYLISKGYDLGPTKADGIWGPYTKEAIRAFKAGIPPAQAPKPTTANTPTAPAPAPAPSQSEPASSTGNDIIPTQGQLTGSYGRTVTGPKGNKIPHPGVDIAAPKGTPVVAPADGKITLVRPDSPTAGNYIEMISSSGERHRFMHLSSMEVKQGAVVKKGTVIGRVGSTGFSTGNHLHWEKYAGSGHQMNPLA